MAINNPDYTHYVVTGGKIHSGWEHKEDAQEAKSEIPKKSGAKVVAKSALKTHHGLSAENDEHWHTNESYMKHLNESVEVVPHFVQSLMEGNIYELVKNAKAELTKRAEFIIESADKQVILAHARALPLEEGEDKITHHVIDTHTGAVVGKYRSAEKARGASDRKDTEYGAVRFIVKPLSLQEMEDQPDNKVSPLSKDEAKKLFKDYKRTAAPSQNNDDTEAHADQAGKDRSGDHSHAPGVDPIK